MAARTDRPVHLIINPHSGYGSERQVLFELRAELRSAGYDVVEYTTRSAGDATRRAKEIASQAGAVLVWGGDGTVNEVANGLSGTEVPIVACQAGTENLLAKELLMPSSPQGIVEVLKSGLEVHCDVGRINHRNFLLIIGIGFDGEVVRRLSAIRTGHISHLSYFWPIWRTLWEHDFPRLKVVADGQEIFNDFGMAFVGNISRYAVGLRICRDARYDDGLFDLVIFSCREQTALMLHAAWTLLRRHPLKGNVIYRQVRHVTFEADRPVPSQVDGDPGPSTPLDIRVTDQKIVLLVPPKRAAWSFWPFTGA